MQPLWKGPLTARGVLTHRLRTAALKGLQLKHLKLFTYPCSLLYLTDLGAVNIQGLIERYSLNTLLILVFVIVVDGLLE